MAYKLKVSVEHTDDWTVLTGEFEVVMKTLTYFPVQLENRYVNVEVFNLRCTSDSNDCSEHLEDFVRQIKRYKNVFKLVKINKQNNHLQRTMDILTFEDYTSSIRKLVNDRLGFFTSTVSYKNLEFYTILFPLGNSSDFKDLKLQLKDMGSIQYFEISKMTNSSLSTVPKLTRREEDSMRRAWHRGYFNYPKDAGLEDIADSLDLTKSTVNFYIRRGVRKSLEYLIESNLYDWN